VEIRVNARTKSFELERRTISRDCLNWLLQYVQYGVHDSFGRLIPHPPVQTPRDTRVPTSRRVGGAPKTITRDRDQ
jgi:hypothetical protein